MVAELGAARPHDVVASFGPRFLEQEVQVEGVLALEAFELALVELRGSIGNLNTPGVGWVARG